MDVLETNTNMETTQTETTKPAGENLAADQAVETTPEKVSALQKFIDGLFGGKKAEAGKEVSDQEPKTETKQEASKGFSQDEVNAAIEAAKKQWLDEQTEQERLKKLSPEEREKEEKVKKDEKISELEKKLVQRELKDTAISDLANEGYPVKLAEILTYSDKDSMNANLKTLKEVFKESLATAINERLKGKTPAGLGGAANAENMIKDQIAKNIRGGMM